MQEYWVCGACHSFNVRAARRCYSCGAPRTEEAREVGVGPHGAVATPGFDESLQPLAWALAKDRGYISVRLLVLLAGLCVMVAVVMEAANDVLQTLVVADALSPWQLVDWLSGPGSSVTVDQLSIGLAVVWLGTYLVGGILCIAVFALSVYNAPGLGAGSPSSSVLGAVLWWFVPILNLVRPYRVVNDVFERLAVRGSTGSKIVGLWWGLFIASWAIRVLEGPVIGLILGLVSRFTGAVPTMRDLIALVVSLYTISDLFIVVSGIFLIRVLLELSLRQRIRREWIVRGAAGPVPGLGDIEG